MSVPLDPDSASGQQSWVAVLFHVLRDAWVWVTTGEPTRLVASGIIWFAVLTITYEQFYGRLGISADDVGLSYINLLTSSVGTALTVLLATILYTSLALVAIRILQRTVLRLGTLSGDVQYRLTAALLIVIAVAISFFYLPLTAVNSAYAVQQGRAVRTPRLILPPISILSIRADRAVIREEEPGRDPSLRRLAQKQLIYLGQANGTLVLYDPESQRPVYVSGGVGTIEIFPKG
jgi:hypothetical protein